MSDSVDRSDEEELPAASPSADDAKRHRDAISRVVPRAQLDSIRLRFTHVEFNALELSGTSWAEDAHLVFDSHLADTSDAGFSAHVQYLIRYLADDELDQAEEVPDYDPDDPPAVELTASFEVLYSLSDAADISDEDLDHFCSMNPIHNTWSFWREYVYNITGRMGIEPVLVPLLPIPVFMHPSQDD